MNQRTTVCDHGVPTVQLPADGFAGRGYVVDTAPACRICKGQPACRPYSPSPPFLPAHRICYFCGDPTDPRLGTVCARHVGALDGVL